MGEGFIVRKGGGGAGGELKSIVNLFTANTTFVAPVSGSYFIECIGPGGDPIYTSFAAIGGSGSGHYESNFVNLNANEEVILTIDTTITSFGSYLSANKGAIGGAGNGSTSGGSGGMAGGAAAATSGTNSGNGGSAVFGGGGGAANIGVGGAGGTYGGGGGSRNTTTAALGGTFGGNGGIANQNGQNGTNTTDVLLFPSYFLENPNLAINLSEVAYMGWRGEGLGGLQSPGGSPGGGGGGFGGNGGNGGGGVGGGGGGGYGANGGNFFGGGGGFGGNGGNGVNTTGNTVSAGPAQGFGAGGRNVYGGASKAVGVGGSGGGYGKSSHCATGLIIVRYLASVGGI